MEPPKSVDMFDPLTLGPTAKCLFIGMSNTGKSYLINHLLCLQPCHDTIVLDDCLFTIDQTQSPIFEQLLSQKTERVFVTVQYGMGLALKLREKLNYIFIFRETIHTNLRKLYKLYCNHRLFPTQDSFVAALRSVTDGLDCRGFMQINEGACLVFDNVHGRCYRYRAPDKTRHLIQDDVTKSETPQSEAEEV